MRAYILSERERDLLRHYLDKGEMLDGFRVLIHYLKKYRATIKQDIDLIDRALEKIEKPGSG